MRPLLCLVLMFLLSFSAWAADSTHRMLIRFDGPETEKYVATLVASLANREPPIASVVSTLDPQATPEAVVKEAKRFACDIVLTITVRPQAGKDAVHWVLASPLESAPRAQGDVTRTHPTWTSAAETYWLFLEDPLNLHLAPSALAWPEAPVAERASFVIEAQAGTIVDGLPKGTPAVGANGQLTVQVEVPVSLFLRGHRDGWLTKPVRVFVDRPDMRVVLDQKPEPRWAMTAGLENFSFPSLGVEWFPDGGRLSYRFGVDTYAIGVVLGGDPRSSLQWGPIVSYPLVSLRAGVAWRWGQPEDQLIVSGVFDVATRLMYPQGRLVAQEPLLPWTAFTAVGLEYRLTRSHALFWEGGPSWGLVTNLPAFRAATASREENSLVIPLGELPLVTWFPWQAKVGYRWAF